jgi:murein DD-endopeptidase MepM/ murein hydrolase activator NlpD
MKESALGRGARSTLLMVSLAAALSACGFAEQPAPVSYRAGPALAPLPPPGTLGRAHPDSIVVEPGQTLFDVSRLYDIPTRAIIDANRLEPPYRLVAGRPLALPQVRTHLVRGGDTVYSVSRQYGVEASTLVATNHLVPPFTIFSGTVLVLPPQAAGPASASASAGGPAGRITATPLPPLPSQGGGAVSAAPVPPAPAIASAPSGAQPAPIAPATSIPPPSPATGASQPVPPAPSPPSAPPPASAAPPASQAPSDQTASLPPPALRGGRGLLWPLRGRIIGRYGPATSGTQNDGINIAAAEGTPVLAADAGTVAYAGNELRGYGNLILIKHPDGWMTAYAHNAQLLVARGQKVQRGQVIARVGATGAVSEPQLHFEVRRGTHALDPMDYLGPAPVSG